MIFLGIWVVTGQFAPQPEKINRNEIKVMLENQWVHRIVLVNDRNVEVSLKTKEEIDTLSSKYRAQRDSLQKALSDSLQGIKARMAEAEIKDDLVLSLTQTEDLFRI